jgi:hypothetical protein
MDLNITNINWRIPFKIRLFYDFEPWPLQICKIFYILILVHKNCKLNFWNFHPLLFYGSWSVQKKDNKKRRLKSLFSNRFWNILLLWKAWKISLQQINRFIVSSIFCEFSSIFMVLVGKGWLVSPKLKVNFFYCSILIV